MCPLRAVVGQRIPISGRRHRWLVSEDQQISNGQRQFMAVCAGILYVLFLRVRTGGFSSSLFHSQFLVGSQGRCKAQ